MRCTFLILFSVNLNITLDFFIHGDTHNALNFATTNRNSKFIVDGIVLKTRGAILVAQPTVGSAWLLYFQLINTTRAFLKHERQRI